MEELRARLAFLDRAWIREADRRGVDGQTALTFFRREARRVSETPTPSLGVTR